MDNEVDAVLDALSRAKLAPRSDQNETLRAINGATAGGACLLSLAQPGLDCFVKTIGCLGCRRPRSIPPPHPSPTRLSARRADAARMLRGSNKLERVEAELRDVLGDRRLNPASPSGQLGFGQQTSLRALISRLLDKDLSPRDAAVRRPIQHPHLIWLWRFNHRSLRRCGAGPRAC